MSILFLTFRVFEQGSSRPLVYAHRGARSLAPENTQIAARVAAEVGADGWEFDVRLTKDNELILMHDDTLIRTTNAIEIFPNRAPWKVADFTLAEIQALDAGSWFVEKDPFGTLASGEVPPEQAAKYRGEKIPTLWEALVLSQELGLLVNIEIKAAYSNYMMTKQDEIAVRKTVELVGRLGLTDRVLISSFNPAIVRRAKELMPDIKTALLTSQPINSVVPLLKGIGADAINPDYRLVKEDELCVLKEHNFEVYLWTVNEIDELEGFSRNPCVTGVITDWPQRLSKLVRP